jgi:hypothetical protein
MDSTSLSLPSAASSSGTTSSSKVSSELQQQQQQPPKKYHHDVLVSQLSTPYDQTTFRNMSINSIAVVPLLSHTKHNSNSNSDNNIADNGTGTNDIASTHSTKSYYEFMNALRRHPYCASSVGSSGSSATTHTGTDTGITLLNVPNNSLTRPSDWKYDTTPFHSFHWSYGCQRILFHDGRPAIDSVVHHPQQQHQHQQQLYYHYTASPSYRNYIDLYPYRRTAAIIGVLNIQDCIPSNTDTNDTNNSIKGEEDRTTMIKQMIQRACEELQQWSYRYSTPTYGASTYGHTTSSSSSSSSTLPTSTTTTLDHDRDIPITRLFVYDSFNIDTPIIDLLQQQTILLKDSNSIIAFPPTTKEHEPAMILHYNLVLSDLMVSIFRNLEQKVLYSNHLITTMSSDTNASLSSSDNNNSSTTASTTGLARRSLARFVTSSSAEIVESSSSTTAATSKVTLGINQLINYVDPESSLVKKASLSTSSVTSTTDSTTTASVSSALPTGPSTTTSLNSTTALSSSSATSSVKSTTISKLLQLLTPMDDELMTSILESSNTSSMMSYKEIELFKKREIGRREKYIGDICLLAGTPLDAYEHYIKAMELLSYKGNTSGTGHPNILDPLWYTATLEACAVAHIVMAEIGGYGYVSSLLVSFIL